MNAKDLATAILQNIGGPDNVSSLVHCATRLRLTLKNNDIANDEQIEQLLGVVGVVQGNGQFQIIIGPDVAKVYRELQQLGAGDHPENNQTKAEKNGILDTVLDYIAGSFTPILPVITAGGMIQVVLSLLVTFGLISETSDTFLVLTQISQAAFYFIPIYLGYSVAKKFKIDPFLGMMLAGVLLIPDMSALLHQEGGVTLFGFELQAITYSSSVLPIFLGVWAMSYVAKAVDKIVPNSLKFVLNPLLTILIVAPITLMVLGPLGYTLGEYIAIFLEFLTQNLGWASVLVMGALSPILVMGGMHYALFPMLVTSFATHGYEMLVVPGMLAANMAQAGAAAAVTLKTKDSNMKQLAGSATITALMGVTEPAMYGVNLRLKKPLIAVIIGGAVGGLWAGITGVRAYALVSSLVALPSYLVTTGNFVNALITCILGFGVAFIVTCLLKFENGDTEAKVTEAPRVSQASRMKEVHLISPALGQIIELSKVADNAFASQALGKGNAVIPTSGEFFAPISGTISVVFPTKHAIGIITKEGIEILIHIGIDTVQLDGDGFESFIEVGDEVSTGQLLVKCDLEKIKANGYDTTTMVVITNTNAFLDVLAANDKEKMISIIL